MIPQSLKRKFQETYSVQDAVEMARLNGLDISVVDINNILHWNKRGCMKGVRKMLTFLAINGYKVKIVSTHHD